MEQRRWSGREKERIKKRRYPRSASTFIHISRFHSTPRSNARVSQRVRDIFAHRLDARGFAGNVLGVTGSLTTLGQRELRNGAQVYPVAWVSWRFGDRTWAARFSFFKGGIRDCFVLEVLENSATFGKMSSEI